MWNDLISTDLLHFQTTTKGKLTDRGSFLDDRLICNIEMLWMYWTGHLFGRLSFWFEINLVVWVLIKQSHESTSIVHWNFRLNVKIVETKCTFPSSWKKKCDLYLNDFCFVSTARHCWTIAKLSRVLRMIPYSVPTFQQQNSDPPYLITFKDVPRFMLATS